MMKQRNWFITGTSSGFGKIMTERLLRQGDGVFATLRRTELLDQLKEKYPDQLKIAHLELTDKNKIQTVVDRAFEAFEKIDVVVSNAGYDLFGAAEELLTPAADRKVRYVASEELTGNETARILGKAI